MGIHIKQQKHTKQQKPERKKQLKTTQARKRTFLGMQRTCRKIYEKWKCAEPECKTLSTTITPIIRHIARNRPYKHLRSSAETICPWCWETYNNLSSVLKRLKIQTQQTTWPLGTCPIKITQIETNAICKQILQYNENMTSEEQQEYTQQEIENTKKNNKNKTNQKAPHQYLKQSRTKNKQKQKINKTTNTNKKERTRQIIHLAPYTETIKITIKQKTQRKPGKRTKENRKTTQRK